MPSHKGQIGFMGGHREDGEVEPVDTALRELQEEGNIQEDQVEVIGIIGPVYTSKNKTIIPVLCTFRGNKDDFFRDLKGNDEWDEMILTPINYLMDPDNWQIAKIFADNHRFVGFCPLKTSESVLYPRNTQAEFLLWGASANMIWNLFNCYK